MEMKTCVAVVKSYFGIAKDGQFVAVDPQNGQAFDSNDETISSDKRSKPFQSFVWSHMPHHLGIVYFIYNFEEKNQFK